MSSFLTSTIILISFKEFFIDLLYLYSLINSLIILYKKIPLL